MHRENEINAILEQVKDWSLEDKVAVAYQILRDMRIKYLADPPRDTLSQAAGLFRRGDDPPPTDEQVKQWAEEERVAKHLK